MSPLEYLSHVRTSSGFRPRNMAVRARCLTRFVESLSSLRTDNTSLLNAHRPVSKRDCPTADIRGTLLFDLFGLGFNAQLTAPKRDVRGLDFGSADQHSHGL